VNKFSFTAKWELEICSHRNIQNLEHYTHCVRFEVFTAVTLKNAVFWNVAPCRSCVNRRFGITYRLHLQSRRIRQRGISVDRWLQSLWVSENNVLRRIFGTKRDEVTGGLRKLHNEELHNVYSSPSMIRMIKWRRMKWVGHVARMHIGY
jgi:hypothetical protein